RPGPGAAPADAAGAAGRGRASVCRRPERGRTAAHPQPGPPAPGAGRVPLGGERLPDRRGGLPSPARRLPRPTRSRNGPAGSIAGAGCGAGRADRAYRSASVMKISAVAILAVLTLAAVAQQSPRLDDIRLSPERLQSIGVTFATAQVENVGDDLRVPGNVAEDEQLQVSVATRVAGWIQQVFVDATYQYVRRGQPLFTLYSPEVAATEQEYLLALGNAKRLAASTVPGVAADAQSLAQAAAARLQQWNVPQAEIERVASSGKALPAFTVVSPAAGYVTVRNVLPNQQVEPQAELYRVNPLSPVWVFAQVNQNNLGRVRTGAPVTVTVDSYPGRVFAGRVEFIYPQIDAATRTARVRLVFDNPGRALMPGMFVNADLKLSFGRRLVVPTSAVLQTGTQAIAFVDEGGGRLSPRP